MKVQKMKEKLYEKKERYSKRTIFSLIIEYLLIPIFIRNTRMELFALYAIGVFFFGMFCYFNYKRYQSYTGTFPKLRYGIEIVCVFIGTGLMYYMDGYIYRGTGSTNFILSFVYTVCIMPFVVSLERFR